ncbi:MAG TPA: hypothetical protein VKT28_00675 [Puia sp.]|nr:hypothetical protein [Puia sp.]
MRIFFSALAIVIPVLAFSQKYNVHSIVVKKNNDSLHVLISAKERQPPTFVKTLDSASGQFHVYKAYEISELIVNNSEYYKSAIVIIDRTPYNEEVAANKYVPKQSTDTVLLKVEYLSNNLKLYSLNDGKRPHFFIQKDDKQIEELIYRKLFLNRNGTAYETEEKKFILQLNELLADCSQAVSDIDNISYTVQAIEKVLDNYNRQCHKENVAQYRKTYKAKFEISALAGISFTSYNLVDNSGFAVIGDNTLKLKRGIYPVIGARFNYIPALLNNKFSILADLYYSGFSASSSFYSNYIDSGFYTRNTIQLKNGYINLAFAARYYLLGENKILKPYINVGYLAGFLISSDNRYYKDDFYNGNHTVTQTDAFPNNGLKKNQFGYFAGAGIIFKKFSLDYRYLNYTNYLDYTSERMTGSSNNITLAYKLN